MSSVLVTGGLGFVGSHIVVELSNSGFTPIIVDDCSNSDISVLSKLNEICKTNLLYFETDIRDSSSLAAIFDDLRPEAVVHCAAKKYVSESLTNPLSYYNNNIGGITSLLDTMRSFGCEYLIFSSSACVYGATDVLPVVEDVALGEVSNPYAFSKQVCERIVHDYWATGISGGAALLRYFNPAGGHSSGLLGENFESEAQTNLFPSIMRALLRRERFSIHGRDHDTPDGTPVRDLIHVVDLARGHVACLRRLLGLSGVFTWNLGVGRGVSVKEVVDEFSRQYGTPIELVYGPRRSGDISSSYANVDKAKLDLNWSAEMTLEDMVADALRGKL